MSTSKKIVKWTGIILSSLLAIVLIAYLVIYLHTEARINHQYSYQGDAIDIPSDSLSISKGKHLFQIRGCEDCHGESLEGSVFINDGLLMQITAPNLTRGRGGLPSDFHVEDWVRVIRHGIDKKGRSLMMMPSQEFYQISNEDLANIIAYCNAQSPVNTSQKRLHSIGPVGRLLMTMDQIPLLPAEKIDHDAIYIAKKDETTSKAYGQYLSTGCKGCHRSSMQGGGPLAPGFPPVPNITSDGNIGNWSEQDFIQTIRTGTTPEGKTLDNEYMPWKSIGHFTDEELKSIYMYLISLPV